MVWLFINIQMCSKLSHLHVACKTNLIYLGYLFKRGFYLRNAKQIVLTVAEMQFPDFWPRHRKSKVNRLMPSQAINCIWIALKPLMECFRNEIVNSM